MPEGRRGAGAETRFALWRWGLWFAVLAGLAEALIVAVARTISNRFILISPAVVWTAPTANAAVFGTVTVVLWLLMRRAQPSKAANVALPVFLFLFFLGPILIVPRLHKYAAILLTAGLAIQGARMLRTRLAFFDRIIRWTLPVLVLLSVGFGAGFHLSRSAVEKRAQASLPAAAAGAPNVILIVMDTVRAQSLSLYGYQRQTSPQLDKFSQSGVVFERALSTAPWTLPSHASIFTARLPHELSADWLTPLNNAHPTLAETLSSRGYVTAGFVANLLYTTAETGLNRGFQHYADFPLTPGMLIRESWLTRGLVGPLHSVLGDTDQLVTKSASDVNGEFLRWLASRPQKPFFAFLNYFDTHAPYRPPPPFDVKFGPGGPQPDITVRRTWSQEEIRRSNDAYDGTIAYLDEQLGKLLAALKTQGVLENTLVIVTSDHGEQFGEHGLFDHGNGLYRQVLHVPLIVSFPTRVPAGLRVSRPVSLINLSATILDLTNATNGGHVLPGQSLETFWHSPEHYEKPEPLYAEVSKAINMPAWLPATKGDMKSVVVGGMHFIRNGDGREELYDFEHDAAETTDLAGRPESHGALEEARSALKDALKR